MSRIGKLPINIPGGVTITVGDDNTVVVKGPKGELSEKISPKMHVSMDNGVLHVTRPDDMKENRALHGLSRSLINNMVIGVTHGYSKSLEIVGVGYRAQKQGNKLVLNLGYSHVVEMIDPEGIETAVDGNKITVKGINIEKVGQFAAEIRDKRRPEPYKGKGIKYVDEVIRRKVGKTGKK